MDDTKLSKVISYALRHKPEAFDLTLDDQGWTDINALLTALHRQKRWRDVTVVDIERIIEESDKQRFEMDGTRIRALYGHSTEKRIELEAEEPPEVLYHGTARRFLASIEAKGLLPQERQYVHLSEDRETAVEVGRRRDDNPVILRVHAKEAFESGIRFYRQKNGVWLSEPVGAEYLEW